MAQKPQMAPTTDLSSLATRAKDAYEQKRTRECLTLAKTLLAADPENAEGTWLQAAVRTDLERTLDDARALLEDSLRHDNLPGHRKAAELLLQKILHIDPEHKEAKSLLSSLKNLSLPVSPANPVTSIAQLEATEPQPQETAFAVESPRIEDTKEKRRRIRLPFKIPFLKVPLVIMGLVVAGLLIATGYTQLRKQLDLSSIALKPRKQFDAQKRTFVPGPGENILPNTAPAAASLRSATLPPVSLPPDPQPVTTVIASAPAPVAPIELGTLAVSSPTAAEIYLGDKHLGSTPITLELPVGSQTLEYRNGDLRQIVTHVVKVNETTTAKITFDVTLQINARPWAQVAVEGTPRRILGQTPLGDVKVPLGSVLIFENPNFPGKTYRVTNKETAIQVVFP